MKITLAENIKMFRKQRSLTQEQLAEVFGVTTGAVHKWESKLSYPELSLIVEMADFFDTSVDVLLGYEMKDNKREATVKKLKECRHEKNGMWLYEVEKALKKYPNDFHVVHECAALYGAFGMEDRNKNWLIRALELLEKSKILITQNADPRINELSVYREMAEVCLNLGDTDKALSLLKEHNVSGIYSDVIGSILAAEDESAEEALPFLSEALLQHITAIFRTIIGYVNVYFAQGDYSSATDVLNWGIEMISGLRDPQTPNFLDKINGTLLLCKAYAEIKKGNSEGAYSSLKTAISLAKQFDSNPTYAGSAVRFVTDQVHMSAYDDIGSTAMEGLQNTISQINDETLSELWKGLANQKE